ncbi:MAG: metal-dependent transcriptional regulator [Clostridia bacterium]|nr:metal-dependent transcriptional regulator [Clostridia bacterium]
MNLQESGEMYLETIYVLGKTGKGVRSIDICAELGYSKPSVSRAVGLLKNGEFINVDGGGYITLTPAGLEVAEKIFERHTVISSLLVRLGVSEETAREDACKIEHVISDEAFEAIKRHARIMG